jgi:hypothetical protein
MSKPETLMIDDVKYVRKDSINKNKMAKVDGLDFVIIRTYSAGVHFGYLKSRTGKEVELVNSRRVWYWKGANSLSQMAIDGVQSGDECKFAMTVNKIVLTEAIEIINCSEKARLNLEAVPVWKK